METRPHGVIPPVVTPFQSDEQLDLDVLRSVLDRLIEAGVHGLFVLGSQGEFFALDSDEKKRVTETTVEHVAGRRPVYVGTGAITTRDAVALTRMAHQAGADGVSVITPYFLSPSDDELYDHFSAVAAASPLPVILYSNPTRTGGVKLQPDTVARLAEIPNVIGIKDSSGDLAATCQLMRAAPDDFAVLMGRDTLIYAGLCCGIDGAIAATANVAPRLVVDIYERFQAGDLQGAREAQDKLVPLREAFSVGTFPGIAKEAMNLIGVHVGPARRPVRPLSEASRARLAELLRGLGLLGDEAP